VEGGGGEVEGGGGEVEGEGGKWRGRKNKRFLEYTADNRMRLTNF